MKRLLIYVHFNRYNNLSEHVVYQIEKLKPLYDHIVFISNSELPEEKQIPILPLINDFIQRENKGFDFGAWRDGLQFIDFEKLKNFDSVTLMNDTCFGPLYDMEPYYEKYEKNQTDFWGMTNHRAYQESKTHYFAEHIQSYFKVFSRKVMESDTFKKFWLNIKDFENVQQVIDNYEIQSTTFFLEAGFKYETILDTKELDAKQLLHPDFSYYAPDVILNQKVPFIKVKAFQAQENAGVGKYMLDYIEEKTNYPINLITNHLYIIDYPDRRYLLSRKYLEEAPYKGINQKIAIHLHVFYPDLLRDFLEAFENFHFEYDLFLTTNTDEKENIIKNKLEEFNVSAKLIRTPNMGRDVMPFLALKDELRNYDIVGHFHTKRSLEAAFFAGESWRTELMAMLIAPADNIMRNFDMNNNLGIVIADVPSFFRFNKIVDPDNENKMIAPIMNDIWKRMNMKKKINFHDFNTFTMSYGTFFWAKVDVLEPLFNLEIMKKEVPEEPLPQNTILHAIERILIYLAWDKNLDFRISKTTENISPFVDVNTFNQRFAISAGQAEDIRLKYITILFLKRLKKFVIYRFGKLFGKS